jgi:hypothetical protein
MPKEMEKGIREMPREAEVIDLQKKTFRRGSPSCAITNCRNTRPDPADLLTADRL